MTPGLVSNFAQTVDKNGTAIWWRDARGDVPRRGRFPRRFAGRRERGFIGDARRERPRTASSRKTRPRATKLWQADALYSHALMTEGYRPEQRVVVFGLFDDRSRLIPYLEGAYGETESRLLAGVKG